MKKALALFLAMLMLLSMTGMAFAETEEDPYFGRFDETVTIRVAEKTADEPGVWTWDDNVWTREWLDRFNIKIDVLWNTGTEEEYYTKLGMAMMTELPDIIHCKYRQFLELQEAGKLLDITDVYNNNIYPYLKNEVIEKQDESVKAMGFVDGRRYAITMTKTQTDTRSIFIRRDYREAVGAEIPTTMEEVVEMGKKFVDAGLAKYALLLQQKVTGDDYSDMQFVANAFGAYPGLWVEGEDGKLVYSPTTEGMKKALDLYKDLYDNGYIQSTFATDVGDNVTAYITNGEIGILPAGFWVATWPLPLVDDDGNVIDWDIIPVVPSETNDDFHVQGLGTREDIEFYAISAECKNPEAVMRLFNHTCSVNTDPALAETDRFHTVIEEDGTEVQVHMHNPAPQYWSVPNENMMTAVAVVEALKGDLSALDPVPHFKSQYDNVMAYLSAVEAGNKEAIQANWGMYKLFGGEDSVFYNFYKNYSAGNYIWDARTVTTENYNRLWGTLAQYENTFYVNYICGTEDTTFEEFVEEWYAMGGRLLTDEINAAE